MKKEKVREETKIEKSEEKPKATEGGDSKKTKPVATSQLDTIKIDDLELHF